MVVESRLIMTKVVIVDWYRYSDYDGQIKTCYDEFDIDAFATMDESRLAMVDRYSDTPAMIIELRPIMVDCYWSSHSSGQANICYCGSTPVQNGENEDRGRKKYKGPLSQHSAKQWLP